MVPCYSNSSCSTDFNVENFQVKFPKFQQHWNVLFMFMVDLKPLAKIQAFDVIGMITNCQGGGGRGL